MFVRSIMCARDNVQDELWLTIDTTKWGRIDPETLETIPATVNVDNISATLNAHPACDPRVGVCYVQHPCPQKFALDTPEVCFSELVPNYNAQGDMDIHILVTFFTCTHVLYKILCS